MVGLIILLTSSISLSLNTVVESEYLIVGLMMLLLAIVIYCFDIDKEIIRLVNTFAVLISILKEVCLLPIGYDVCIM